MSFTITEAFVKEYESTFYHLAQQKDSRLAPHARQVSQSSKMKFFNRIGTADPVQITNRHGDTPFTEVPHSRRAVVLQDWDAAELVDDMDMIRTLNDPTNDYIQAFKAGFNRRKDVVFYNAALGSALAGEDGTTSVVLPNAQKIAAVTGAALSTAMTINTLRHIKQKFRAAEVLEGEDSMIHMTMDAEMERDLLATTEVGSQDYNSVKALVNGEVDTFMGIKFHNYESLVAQTDGAAFSVSTGEYDGGGTSGDGGTQYLAWVKSGMIFSTGKDIKARISERDDKRYSVQPYVCMSIGAVRMEEVKVLRVTVKRS